MHCILLYKAKMADHLDDRTPNKGNDVRPMVRVRDGTGVKTIYPGEFGRFLYTCCVFRPIRNIAELWFRGNDGLTFHEKLSSLIYNTRSMAQKHGRAHAYTHAHTRTDTFTHARARTHARTHTHAHTQTCTYARTHAHTHAHTTLRLK